MATLTGLPLIGRFFGAPPKKASARSWQDEYRTACFVLKSFDSAVLGEIKASYSSELNSWNANSDEASLLAGEWGTIQEHHDAWVVARRVDADWKATVAKHIGRSLHEITMLYRHLPESDELRLFLEV